VPESNINPKWLRGVERHLSNQKSLSDNSVERSLPKLEEYSRTGKIKKTSPLNLQHKPLNISPAFEDWESVRLERAISQYGNGRNYLAEYQSIKTGVIANDLFLEAFDLLYLQVLMESYSIVLDQQRFPDRERPLQMSMGICALAAYGFAIGLEKRSLTIARIALSNFHKGLFLRNDYPIYQFCLGLFSSYMGSSMSAFAGEACGEGSLAYLLDNWDVEDADLLAPYCRAACDYHTQRCQGNSKNGNEFYEFSDGLWWYTPFEIFLLFKLREKKGLSNPLLAHPLMQTCLGKIPAPIVAPKKTELLVAIEEKMVSQGYCEQRIIETILS
jgi:hypothetical protein